MLLDTPILLSHQAFGTGRVYPGVSNYPSVYNGHGTAVAALAVAGFNSSPRSAVGVAPQARLISYPLSEEPDNAEIQGFFDLILDSSESNKILCMAFEFDPGTPAQRQAWELAFHLPLSNLSRFLLAGSDSAPDVLPAAWCGSGGRIARIMH